MKSCRRRAPNTARKRRGGRRQRRRRYTERVQRRPSSRRGVSTRYNCCITPVARRAGEPAAGRSRWSGTSFATVMRTAGRSIHRRRHTTAVPVVGGGSGSGGESPQYATTHANARGGSPSRGARTPPGMNSRYILYTRIVTRANFHTVIFT